MKKSPLKLMNNLNSTIYSSLKDYQETYEFYRSKQEVAEVIKLKSTQDPWDSDVNNQRIA